MAVGENTRRTCLTKSCTNSSRRSSTSVTFMAIDRPEPSSTLTTTTRYGMSSGGMELGPDHHANARKWTTSYSSRESGHEKSDIHESGLLLGLSNSCKHTPSKRPCHKWHRNVDEGENFGKKFSVRPNHFAPFEPARWHRCIPSIRLISFRNLLTS